MARRALPALLALVALCADLSGAHALASLALVVGGVPRLAVSAVVMCLLVYVGQAIAAVLRHSELARATASDASGEEQERLAA